MPTFDPTDRANTHSLSDLERLAAVVGDLASRAARDTSDVARHLRDAMRDGFPARGDGPSSGGGNPTERAATTKDEAAADLNKLRQHLQRAERDLIGVEGILSRHGKPLQPQLQGCKSCARLPRDPKAARRFEPTEDANRDRCRWCRRWAEANGGQLPPVAVLEAHHQGKRLTPSIVAALTAK